MVQYQNCAPGNEVLAEGEAPIDNSNQIEIGDAGGTVDVIDQVEVGGISFTQKKISAQNNEEVVVFGVCDQSGSLIGWKLKNANGDVLEKGLAECDLGAFEVALNEDMQNHCDENLDLSAALGADASSHTVVEVSCD